MKNIPARTYTRPIKEVNVCNLNSVELPDELENTCRLCLENTDVMIEIFQEESVVPTHVKIRSLLCIEIDEEDQLPSVICACCQNQLDNFYSFKKRCKASDVKLRQLRHRWQLKASASYNAINDICMTDEIEIPCQTLSKSECTMDWDSQVPLASLIKVESIQSVIKDQIKLSSPSDRIGQSLFKCDVSNEKDLVSNVIDNKRLRPVSNNTVCDPPRLFETMTEDIPEDKMNNSEENQPDKPFFTSIAEEVSKILQVKSDLFTNMPVAQSIDIQFDEDDIPLEKRLAGLTKRVLKRLKCVRCKNKFDNHNEYLEHREVCLRSFKCKLCPKEFKTNSMLARHMRTHTGERPFSCVICNRAFSQNEILQRHIANCHESNKPFQCTFCQKSFALLSLLKGHLNDSHSDKRHKCQDCYKDFQHASGLSRHRAVHNGTRYICQTCKRIFMDSTSAKRHAKKRKHQPKKLVSVKNMCATRISRSSTATEISESSTTNCAIDNKTTKKKSTGFKIIEIISNL